MTSSDKNRLMCHRLHNVLVVNNITARFLRTSRAHRLCLFTFITDVSIISFADYANIDIDRILESVSGSLCAIKMDLINLERFSKSACLNFLQTFKPVISLVVLLLVFIRDGSDYVRFILLNSTCDY